MGFDDGDGEIAGHRGGEEGFGDEDRHDENEWEVSADLAT